MKLSEIDVNFGHLVAYLLGMGTGYYLVNWGKRKLEEYMQDVGEKMGERFIQKYRSLEEREKLYVILESYGRELRKIQERLEKLERGH